MVAHPACENCIKQLRLGTRALHKYACANYVSHDNKSSQGESRRIDILEGMLG